MWPADIVSRQINTVYHGESHSSLCIPAIKLSQEDVMDSNVWLLTLISTGAYRHDILHRGNGSDCLHAPWDCLGAHEMFQ